MPAGSPIGPFTLTAASTGPGAAQTPPGSTAAYVPPAPQPSGSPAGPVLFVVRGVFAGLRLLAEGSFDLSGGFAGAFPIAARRSADSVVRAGPLSVPDSTAASPQASAYYLFPDGGMAVRLRVVAPFAGSPVVEGRTVDSPGPPAFVDVL
jgi:hypothetical protein